MRQVINDDVKSRATRFGRRQGQKSLFVSCADVIFSRQAWTQLHKEDRGIHRKTRGLPSKPSGFTAVFGLE